MARHLRLANLCAPSETKIGHFGLFRRSCIVHVNRAIFLGLFAKLGQDVVCTIQFLAVLVKLGKMSKAVCVFYEFFEADGIFGQHCHNC